MPHWAVKYLEYNALHPHYLHSPTSQVPFMWEIHPHRTLTLALMGIIDAMDVLASSCENNATRGMAMGLCNNAVPSLHSANGGLGRMGCSLEPSWGCPASFVNKEKLSSAVAREFLSWLLLMLACFFILCLLLFLWKTMSLLLITFYGILNMNKSLNLRWYWNCSPIFPA